MPKARVAWGRGASIIALMLLPGCLEAATDHAPPMPPPTAAGTWIKVLDDPRRNEPDFATKTERGIAFKIESTPTVPKSDPPSLQYWEEGSGRLEEIQRSPRGFFAIAGLGDELLVFTRVRGDGSPSGGTSLVVHRLDLETRAWRTDPIQIPDDRNQYTITNSAHSLVVDGIVYLYEGCCEARPESIWAYNPRTFELERVTSVPIGYDPNHPYGNVLTDIGWDGASLIVASNGRGESPGRIHRFDIRERQWELLEQPRYAFPGYYGAQYFTYNDTIWALGGSCVWRSVPPYTDFVGDVAIYPRVYSPMTANNYPFNTSSLHLLKGVELNGKRYVYGSGLIGSNALYEWTPPDPEDWPDPRRLDNRCNRTTGPGTTPDG